MWAKQKCAKIIEQIRGITHARLKEMKMREKERDKKS
jgi:hypothetical protein